MAPDLLLTAFALLASAAGLAALAVRRVPEGRAYSVHRFGHFARSLGPGWHLVWPLVDRVARRVDLVGHHIDLHYERERVAADAAVYYQILEPGRTGAALDDVDGVVQREAAEGFADLMPQLLPGETGGGAVRLKEELNRRLGNLGLRVIRCQLHLPGI
ncbi:MAG TPA: SPFH domain-containing protein [Xanthomonadaceae bacterium]|nr:SPFH domain-containing protein [Xanthomonadaceae bacterium]